MEAVSVKAAVVPVTARRWLLYGSGALVCAGILETAILREHVFGGFLFEDLVLHAVFETFGCLAAVITALLLLQQEPRLAVEDAPAAIGLLGMGVLDGLHALSLPGHGFVWLHTLATLVGALGFALSWWPVAHRRVAFWTRWLPAAVTLGAGAAGLSLLLGPGLLELTRGAFPSGPRALHLAAGVLLVASVPRFLIDFQRSRRLEPVLFAAMGLLLGTAAFMFSASTIWDGPWWAWHAVRLNAFMLALWLSRVRHLRAVAGLHEALEDQRGAREALEELTGSLEQRVQERTAELEAHVEARKRAEEAEHFLSEASKLLASSIDYSTTLAQVAQLAVPRLADYCLVLMVGADGSLRPVKAVCADPGKADLAREMERSHALPESAASMRVLRSGQAELSADLSDADLVAAAAGPEHLAVMRRAGIRSRVAVPLNADGDTFGVLVFAAAESGRRYGRGDLALFEEVGRRATQAITSARLYDAAQRAVRTREDLLAVVSHDLRNPLNAVTLNAALVERLAPDGDGGLRLRGKAQQIRRAAERMDLLIRDLLDAAAIEAGRFPIVRARHDVQQLVDEALELMQPMARAGALRLEWRRSGPLRQVECDRGRVLQIFSNLIGNAIKFTPKEGSILVSADEDGESVRFSVSDTGAGIPGETLGHLFERYTQAARSGRAGAGLGLYIVKGIAEAHGGKAWASNEPGAGSTFYFTLPAAESPQA